MLASIRSAAVLGVQAYEVTVEVDVARGLPNFTEGASPSGTVNERARVGQRVPWGESLAVARQRRLAGRCSRAALSRAATIASSHPDGPDAQPQGRRGARCRVGR